MRCCFLLSQICPWHQFGHSSVAAQKKQRTGKKKAIDQKANNILFAVAPLLYSVCCVPVRIARERANNGKEAQASERDSLFISSASHFTYLPRWLSGKIFGQFGKTHSKRERERVLSQRDPTREGGDAAYILSSQSVGGRPGEPASGSSLCLKS